MEMCTGDLDKLVFILNEF